MTEWARAHWNFLHTQGFYVDLHEHHGLAAQHAFVNLLQTLPAQLPCTECRAHLAAFLQSDPPPKPGAFEPEDYVYAKHIWRMHNSVNRRLNKPEPTFAAVVDHYVNGRQDVACSSPDMERKERKDSIGSTSSSESSLRGTLPSTPASDLPSASASPAHSSLKHECGIPNAAAPVVVCVAGLILAVIVMCAVLESAALRRRPRQ